MSQPKLNAENALVFRITHRDNLPWVFDHGLHCARSAVQDPGFVGIGNADLISCRRDHPLPPPCQGTLGDYVPFYFTPYSPMLNNIRAGWGGVTRRERDEIVFLVTSLPRLAELGIDFVFSDRHAYLATAQFSDTLTDLANWIPWQQLQTRDFKKDPDDPGEFERYQAEALVFQQVPIQALLGIVCHGDASADAIRGLLADRGIDLQVHVRPNWYF